VRPANPNAWGQPQGGLQPQQFQQPQQQQPAQEFVPNTTDPTKMSEVLPIWQWQGNVKGGLGESMTTGDCPACGSARFFSRTNGGGVMNANTGVTYYPKPECADCGYPNEQGSLGVSAQATGSALPSRQGAAPAPPGAIGRMAR
jgi:hypothetical protein